MREGVSMKRFKLLMVAVVAAMAVYNVCAMDSAYSMEQNRERRSSSITLDFERVTEKKRSPRQFKSAWMLNEKCDCLVKIDFPKKSFQEIVGEFSQSSFDILIDLTEWNENFCQWQNEDIQIIKFPHWQDAQGELVDYARKFCDLIKQYKDQGHYIAIYGAGNDKAVYLLLACLFVSNYVDRHISDDSVFTNYQGKNCIFREAICIDDSEFKQAIVDEILSLVYRAMLPSDVMISKEMFNIPVENIKLVTEDHIQYYISPEDLVFIELFCKQKLMPTGNKLLRRGSSSSMQKPTIAISPKPSPRRNSESEKK